MDRSTENREKKLVSTRSSSDLRNELRLHAYRIKLNSVVSKRYLGERKAGKMSFYSYL